MPVDLLIEAFLWLLILSGSLAFLALLAKWIEDWAAAFDAWLESVCTNYVDDDDFVAR